MPIQTLIEDTPVPVKIWTDDVEELAKRQLRNTATLPFVYHHIAAMPDPLHEGALLASPDNG
ncbi:MAG: RtcB family protein [Acidobacteria bacterium]|nr:RtcB family protein [Acidobacteriota bacterium]